MLDVLFHTTLFLLGIVCISGQTGWLETPENGVVHVCTGDTASLRWRYDETLGTLTGVNVVRSGQAIVLVSKIGTDPPQPRDDRVTFLPNAGANISNVVLGDAGKYVSTVVFTDGSSIYNEVTLEVYEGCPNRMEFANPKISLVYLMSNKKTDLNLPSSLGELVPKITVKVPEGQPLVNCSLYIDGRELGCESADAEISKNTKTSVNVRAVLSHIALGQSSKSLLVKSSPDTPQGASTCDYTSYQVGIGILAIVLIVVLLFFVYVERETLRKLCGKGDNAKKPVKHPVEVTLLEPKPV